MTVERLEIRLAGCIGIAIWIHLTHDIFYGLWSVGGVVLCVAWAYWPAFVEKQDKAKR